MKSKFYLQDAIDLGTYEKAVDWFRATFHRKRTCNWDDLFKVCPSQYVWWLAYNKLITSEALKTTLETYQIGDHAWACYCAVYHKLITEEGWLGKMGYEEIK